MNPLTLSKDEVQKLNPDQQETFAQIVVQETQSRLRLLDQARRYQGRRVFGGLLGGLGTGLAILSTVVPKALPFAIIVVSSAVAFHAAGLNQRLDALIQLLEKDIKQIPEINKPAGAKSVAE